MSSGINYRAMEDLKYNLERMAGEQAISFLTRFLTQMGLRALAQTTELTPVSPGGGRLKGAWELSQVYLEPGSKDTLCIDLINPELYASFVEDGHYQANRWVPGEWAGNKFIYQPGSRDSGMMLQEQFIPGVHMARIAISRIQNEIPTRLEKDFQEFLAGLSAGVKEE